MVPSKGRFHVVVTVSWGGWGTRVSWDELSVQNASDLGDLAG